MWYGEKKEDVAASHPALGHQLIYYCGFFVVQEKALSRLYSHTG